MIHRILVTGLLLTGVLCLWKMAKVQGAGTSKLTVVPVGPNSPRNSEGAILFTSAGKTAMVSADGTGLRWLEFDVPEQVTWQVGGFFIDGRFLLLSMEARRDGPGKPFDKYYTQTPTHLWRYDVKTNQLEELVTRERRAPFITPMLLIEDDRILVQVVKGHVGQAVSMKLDGTDARDFTRAGEGLPYGLSMSPDGRRVAFHLASQAGYQVWTSDLDGKNRVQIAAHPDHLYFGTSWSPDGQWIVFHDCHFKQDPGHDWSDLCIGRSDGSENRVLTQGQAQWFAATYGPPKARGGGSNMPVWTPDGQLLFSCRTLGSKVPWEFQTQRSDVDHFNRDYKPDAAQGGTQICRFNPKTGKMIHLTPSQPQKWDFRGSISPNGRQIAFCRTATGQVPALWIMNADGTDALQIATGWDGQGIDHPRWIPSMQKAEHAGPARRWRVLYNFDGDSCMSTRAGGAGPVEITVDDLTTLIEEIAYDGSQVDTMLVCINAQVMYYPTKVGTMRGTLSTVTQRSKWPASEKQRFENMERFFNAGIDPYAVLLAEAKRRGLEGLLTFRMNDAHGNDFLRTQFWIDHPDWRLDGGALNFSFDGVRNYIIRLIEEAVQRYDCDGIELDFNRFPTFFKDGTTEERIAKMNSLVRRVRKMLDEVGAKRGQRLMLAVRVPSNYGRTPPSPASCREIGCDLVAWTTNGWIDFVTVSEFLHARYDLPIKPWKEVIRSVPVYGGIECTEGGLKDQYLTSEKYLRAARHRWQDGADGIYLFNFFTTREFGEESWEPPFEVLRELGNQAALRD